MIFKRFSSFLPAAVIALALVSPGAFAAPEKPACAMPKPTDIIVIPSTEDIEYDFDQKLVDIQDVEMDTVDPYGIHATTTTQGFMKGGIKIKPEVKLDFQTVRRSGGVCLWYDSIKIEVEIDPTIVIGKEVAKDKCMKKAVLEHEHKHIRADREIVNKYAQETAQKVYALLKKKGFLVGPVAFDQGEAAAAAMYEQVFEVIRYENKVMQQERAKIQQAIDSKEEYDRVAALCPEFNPQKFMKQDKKSKKKN
jgi:hypothetical protein